MYKIGQAKRSLKRLLHTLWFFALDGTGNLAGTQATGAGVNTLGTAVYNRFDAPDVGLPGSVRTSVRVRNLYTESNILATNITFCHVSAPPLKGLNRIATVVFYQIHFAIASFFVRIFEKPANISTIAECCGGNTLFFPAKSIIMIR